MITGGGRGFGLAFGHALAERGAHVFLIDVDADAGNAGADAIRAAGGTAAALAGDVTDPERMAGAMAEACDPNGGIDVLINNAGLHSQAYSRPILEMGGEKVRRLFDVNVMGTLTCTLAAHPHLRGREGANIVNIASAAGHLGSRMNAYGTSKLAVAGLTLAFANEFGADGIRVNAISPGLIFTDTIEAELSPENKALAKSMQMIDADGREGDVVEAMLYLSGARARFVTGEVLRVGGGMGAGT